jgi:DMSO/TMAO reductase YedYZ molybdopterin-dependent catalytic subunit
MRKTALRLIFIFLILPVAFAASARQASPSISVSGDVKQPLTLTAADLAAMPRAKAVTDNNGVQTTYEGVWLSDVLKKAGVPLGPGLRGPALAGYVLASASDGYQVVFSIGELDPDMTDNQFLLADTANGKPLFGENGAFRLVIPKDKRGARSVRLLSKIEVVHLRK